MNKNTFKELKLKRTYFNSEDDPINDFLIPVLKNSKEYKRTTYSFSSGIYSLINTALLEMLKNNCKIKYIVGFEINSDDVEAIETGLKDISNIIETNIIQEFGSIEEFITKLSDHRKDIYKDRLKILSYLISKGILEIKVGFRLKGNKIKNPEKNKFHPKNMIFEDFSGNIIATNGSFNESFGAMINNEESMAVFTSWDQKEWIEDYVNVFDKYWNNTSKGIKTIKINTLLENNIFKNYKLNFKNIEDVIELERKLNVLLDEMTSKDYKLVESEKNFLFENSKKFKLRDYQEIAVNNWFKKGSVGIFAMATGTGKTYTAIGCIKKIIEKEKKIGIIITTPQDALTEQWIDSLKKFDLNGETIFGSKGITTLAGNIQDVKLDDKNYFILATTFHTFYKSEFIAEIKSANFPLLLVCDEVHGVIAPEFRKGLIENYNYRLGLSATPKRHFNEEETNLIYDYFYKGKYDEIEGDTYTFDIKRAINENYLCKYDYHPYFCSLTSSELEEYKELSKKIAKSYFIKNNSNSGETNNLGILSNKRKSILKNAEEKILISKEILFQINPLKRCLFFLDTDKQITKLKSILNSDFKYVTYKTFTSKFFAEAENNKLQILEDFSKDIYNILLSIDCFTEGIDVPSVENAVLIASSTNPKEFIQRRGRVLRNYPGKKKANIYDILIIPENLNVNNKEDLKLAQSLIRTELIRYKIFLDDSQEGELKEKNKKIYKEILFRFKLENE